MHTRATERSEGRADAAPAPDPLVESFERRVEEFAAAARRVRAGADAEAIHDLRVASRRLAAALRVWGELAPKRAARAARRLLRRIRRRVGGAREVEVHVALLEEHLPADAAPDASLARRVLDRLRERLIRRRRAAARRVSPRRLKRVLRRLEAVGTGLGAPRIHGGDGLAPALAVERRLADEAAAGLRAACEHPDDVALHEARVQVKKWRYTLECLEEVAPAQRQSVRPLRRIQGELGDVHDRALLCELLERHAHRAGPADDGTRRVIGGLEIERERAVRRFRRLATAFLARARDAATEEPPLARPPSPPLKLEPPALEPAPVEPPPAPLEDGDADGRADGGAKGDDAPRDDRWDRMASWLTRPPRRG